MSAHHSAVDPLVDGQGLAQLEELCPGDLLLDGDFDELREAAGEVEEEAADEQVVLVEPEAHGLALFVAVVVEELEGRGFCGVWGFGVWVRRGYRAAGRAVRGGAGAGLDCGGL